MPPPSLHIRHPPLFFTSPSPRHRSPSSPCLLPHPPSSPPPPPSTPSAMVNTTAVAAHLDPPTPASSSDSLFSTSSSTSTSSSSSASISHLSPDTSHHDSLHLALSTLPAHSHVLLVGLTPSIAHSLPLLHTLDLTVVVLDCPTNPAPPSPLYARLRPRVRVYRSHFTTFRLPSSRYFDHVLFNSNALSHAPNASAKGLRHVIHHLLNDREVGRVMFLQTLRSSRSWTAELLARSDFMYDQDFDDCMFHAGLSIVAIRRALHPPRRVGVPLPFMQQCLSKLAKVAAPVDDAQCAIVTTRCSLYVPRPTDTVN